MGERPAARSFLEQLADYDDPAPKDFDPEQDHNEQNHTNLGNSADQQSRHKEAREHYADVGKSGFRDLDGVELGPRYSGSSVSRKTHQSSDIDGEEDEEDEPFVGLGSDGTSEVDDLGLEEADDRLKALGRPVDGQRSKDEGEIGRATLEASPTTSSHSSEDDHSDDDDSNDDDNDDDEESESHSSPPPRAQNDRAALRRMMADEQKTVAATLSAAANADIVKGKAIKQQRSTFDSLLSTRIKLQKALIASNSMAVAFEPSATDSINLMEDCALASHAAEEAALNLWNSITSLRNSLHPNGTKKPFPPTAGISSQALWEQTASLDDQAASNRRATLTKWSQRTNPVTNLRPPNRLLQTPVQQPLTAMLEQQFTGDTMDRAIKRTRIARSCAPIQAASKIAVEDEDVFDDADFYSLLLRELVDRRMADTQSASSIVPVSDIASIVPSRADLKVKKQVDTKASKGRKMRYTVHEKLQNFMAAEDRGSWGERQREELFGSLLGRKVEMGEIEADDEDMQDEDADVDAGGLKLFGP